MCGIVGIVHRGDGPPVSIEPIRQMCRAIAHRGPDDEGFHVAGRVGLGMRRLSIIDLPGGHQPVYNEDRTKVLVYNGEIYNYRDLRRGLLARGHILTTHGDTETIVHLYEDLGGECVQELRGMFAFALWDETAQQLTLARDRFGIKPLYYVDAPWGIAFASEMKALIEVGLTRGRLDWDALDVYLQLGYVPAPSSPFQDVKKLPPGHILQWSMQHGTSERRYWDVPTDPVADPTDAATRVLEWIDDSVTAHLESDVPVAAFLSGGLDSSAVVASMAVGGHSPHAFTARYHGTGADAADETPLAKKMADRYGTRLTVIDIRPDIRKIFEPVVRALDEPHADDSAIPTWLISEAVSADYKVALAGTGGDELFAGYPRHIGVLAGGYYNKLPAPLRAALSAAAHAIPEPRGASLWVDRLKRFLRSGYDSEVDRLIGYANSMPNAVRSNLYNADIRHAVGIGHARTHLAQLLEDGGAPTGLRAALYLDYKAYLPDDLLALSDRISMAHSLEIRVPFVDHRLVEAVFPLSDRLKIGRRMQNKHLLRRALRTRLPPGHFHAPKRGFVGPTGAWLRNELREVVSDELSVSRMDRLGYFDGATVGTILDDHFARRHNREGIIWALLCFTTWHRLFVESYSQKRYRPAPDVINL